MYVHDRTLMAEIVCVAKLLNSYNYWSFGFACTLAETVWVEMIESTRLAALKTCRLWNALVVLLNSKLLSYQTWYAWHLGPGFPKLYIHVGAGPPSGSKKPVNGIGKVHISDISKKALCQFWPNVVCMTLRTRASKVDQIGGWTP